MTHTFMQIPGYIPTDWREYHNPASESWQAWAVEDCAQLRELVGHDRYYDEFAPLLRTLEPADLRGLSRMACEFIETACGQRSVR